MDDRTLGELAQTGPVLPDSVSSTDIDEYFRTHDLCQSVVVTSARVGLVLVNRGAFYQAISGPLGFGWALHHERAVAGILDKMPRGVTMDAGSSVVEAGLSLLGRSDVDTSQDVLVTWPDGRAATLAVSRIFAELSRAFSVQMARLDAQERHFRALVQSSTDVIMVVDQDRRIRYLSPASQDVTGYDPEERIGAEVLELVHPEDLKRVRTLFDKAWVDPTFEVRTELRHRTDSGGWRWLELTGRNLFDDAAVGGFVVNYRDMTERRRLEERLRHQAFHDELTGLPNRALVKDRALGLLDRAASRGTDCAVLLIDLDDFKDVNDVLGHAAGDALLTMVGERLRTVLRTSDTVGRLGGDEFVALLEGWTADTSPESVAARALEVLRRPFDLDGRSVRISGSIGVAMGLRPSSAEFLRDADIALYRAKAMGRDCFAVFTPAMRDAVESRLGLDTDLRSALDENQFLLHYQPTYRLADGSVHGVEALLRWAHPARGLVGPADFIPALDESGLIRAVGRWVLHRACTDLAALNAERGGAELALSVNISARQLDGDQLLDDLTYGLGESGLPARLLTLELTETALVGGLGATATRIASLKSLGVGLAIDDFGTGYSSLSYLEAFPVDSIKIDRAFVARSGTSGHADALLHSLIQMGRALSFTVVAEGIETETQLAQLRAEGCELGQGYFLGRPVPLEELR